MKLTLQGPDIEPFRPEHDLRVLVAHEDVHCAIQARSLLERIARCSGEKGRVIISMWKFNVLALEALRKTAAEEATEADLIVIAARERDALPDGVLTWIGLWRAGKMDRKRTLVALLEPPDPSEDGRLKPQAGDNISSYLEMLARLDNMDFFTSGSGREGKIEYRVRGVGDTVAQGEAKNRGALRLEALRPSDVPPIEGGYLLS